MPWSEAFTSHGYDSLMLPIPSSNLFRSRRKAMWYAFWVIVGAVLSVPFAPGGSAKPDGNVTAQAPDATAEALNQADFAAIADAIKSQ